MTKDNGIQYATYIIIIINMIITYNDTKNWEIEGERIKKIRNTRIVAVISI